MKCPREPLPLEGAAERNEAGLASFFAALGCSRKGRTCDDLSRSFSSRFPPSNLRPFGAPPSIGRRECPHEPLPLEGAAERSEAGLASFFAAKPPPLCLPHWGRGTAPAVDRVLSQTAYLRRSFPLFFIPLVPYPARFARHLPHAGKALSIGIVFSTYPVFALTMQENRYSRFAAFPIGEGGPRQRWIGCSRLSST